MGHWYVLTLLDEEGLAAIRDLPRDEQERLKRRTVSARVTADMRVRASFSVAIAARGRAPAQPASRRYGARRGRAPRRRNVRSGPPASGRGPDQADQATTTLTTI